MRKGMSLEKRLRIQWRGVGIRGHCAWRQVGAGGCDELILFFCENECIYWEDLRYTWYDKRSSSLPKCSLDCAFSNKLLKSVAKMLVSRVEFTPSLLWCFKRQRPAIESRDDSLFSNTFSPRVLLHHSLNAVHTDNSLFIWSTKYEEENSDDRIQVKQHPVSFLLRQIIWLRCHSIQNAGFPRLRTKQNKRRWTNYSTSFANSSGLGIPNIVHGLNLQLPLCFLAK
jgi:hypothetical protein